MIVSSPLCLLPFFLFELFTERAAEVSSVPRLDFGSTSAAGVKESSLPLRAPLPRRAALSFCLIPANRNWLYLEEIASYDSNPKAEKG